MPSKRTEAARSGLIQMHQQISSWGTPENCYQDSGLWKFLSYVRTKDEYARGQVIRPFPVGKEYIAALMLCLLHFDTLAVLKSRQIMVTWSLAAFLPWVARTDNFRRILFQSKKEDDAYSAVTLGDKNPVAGRMSFIELNLPDWLRDPYIGSGGGNRAGRLSFSQRPLDPTGVPILGYGSEIIACPQGPDQVRSHTPSVYASDETAFQEDCIDAYANAKAAANRVIMVSTPTPGDYVDMVLEGDEVRRAADWLPGGKQMVWFTDTSGFELPQGMRLHFTKSGLPVLWIHYTADPDLRPETAAGKEALERRAKGYPGGMDGSKWLREMEIDCEATGGMPVFPHMLRAPHENPVIKPRRLPSEVLQKVQARQMKLVAGFDYGSTNPSAFVVWGIDKDRDAWALWEHYEPMSNLIGWCETIKACPYFTHLEWIIADRQCWADDQQQRDGKTSIAALMAMQGVRMSQARRGVDDEMAIMFNSTYWADPDNPRAFITDACPNLIRECRNLRWQQHKSAEVRQTKNAPDKIQQFQNHLWDATAYVFDRLPRPYPKVEQRRERGTLAAIERQLRREAHDQQERRGLVNAW